MAGSFLQNDLAHLVASSDFGEATNSVTWKGTTVQVIFDSDDNEVQLGEGPTEIMNQPVATGVASDFSGIADGDVMVIRGATYKVKNWMGESDGMIEIFLEKQ